MAKITPKIGFIIFGVSLALLIVEIFVSMFLGVAMQGISSESGIMYIFNVLNFIIVLTATVGILAPIIGALNKWDKINISWKLFIILSLLLGTILFFSLGGTERMGSRWGHYAGGGSYIGSNPVFSPDGTKVIFSSPITGHGDIYVMEVDGSNKKKLTASNDYEGEPIYSPDGSAICFIREQRERGQIFIMDKDGNNQKQLTSGDKYLDSCSFSPDSKQIAYYSASDRKICIINTDATNQKCLTDDNVDKASPVFSSDGKNVYYYTVKDGGYPNYEMLAVEIWKLDVNTLKKELVSTMQGELYDIKYSPDFKKIIYLSLDHTKGDIPTYTYQIFTSNIDGSLKKKLTDTKGLKTAPSFSSDESKIIFLSEPRGRGGDIIIMNNDGSGLKSIGKTN